ncbi:hypothetical protein FKW77_003395 [Venturia effusa]|uniref:Importin N-terminal domain-containing protein n=1 Tax=Venturia effusa TaxID=50376 RepID=A0A517LPV2_9PEZI|nr:hypothetical protein FKW77_003395 [Venturia effusa]
MMTWAPQPEPLQQLLQCLKDSLSPVASARQNAELMLRRAAEAPDYTNYLAYLTVNSQQPSTLGLTPESYHVARSAAAVALRNVIRASYKQIPDANKTYLRSVILGGLQDQNVQIRNYTGNVITEIVRQGGIMQWPLLLSNLIALVDSKDTSLPQRTREGAMSALLKMCEDNKRALDREYSGERPLAFVFPKLLEFTRDTSPIVRATALSAIIVFLPEKSPVVLSHLDGLLQCLFALANDPSNDVRKYVCRCFIRLAEISPEKITPYMEGLVAYIIAQQQNPDDPELALDAAEFWLCLGEDERLSRCLGPYLPTIVPVLLESMVYGEDDQFRLEGEQEDAEQEDKAEDIKPAFATAKGGRLTGTNGDSSENSTNSAGPSAAPEDDNLSDGEIEDDEDDDEDEDPEEQWNLRKCSAAALDTLASHFNQAVFEITLPYLKDNLSASEWPRREAAVLAVGAIADGCMDIVQPHLPELTRYLLALLQDSQAVVRSITCWAIGRYSAWPAHLDASEQRQYFEPIMEALLTKMLDRNKRVQEAAASAFANLEEKAKSQLKPYSVFIVRQFVKCFGIYKDRNMYILYDCVQTLAEHVGPSLRDPELVNLLMPALLQRWTRVADQSREMFPLLECLSYVALALGEAFTPFAEPIFTRCISIIHQNLQDTFNAVNNPAVVEPDKDFLVTSLDLLSGIVQAMGVEKQTNNELVSKSTPNFFQILAYCLKDAHNDVRQSAYALLGDCAIYVFPQLQQVLPTILDILLDQLDVDSSSYDADSGFPVVNNACWSLGEIAVRQKQEMGPYVDRILNKLGAILFNQKIPESLNENAAIALGRLGIGCPEKLAPHLSVFALPWLQAMSRVQWTEEKANAFWGFNLIVLKDLPAMEKCLLEYFNETATIPATSLLSGDNNMSKVKVSFQQVIAQYRSMIPTFDQFLRQLPEDRYKQFVEIEQFLNT